VYFVVALWGEGVYQYYQFRDVTPPYNVVNLAQRNLPPLSRADVGTSRHRDIDANDVPTSRRPDVQPSHLRPSTFFLLGTDNLGRSVAQRLVQGTRIAFHVGIVTSLIAIPLGVILGLCAGFFGRWVDSLLSGIAAVFASIPAILLILAIAMLTQGGLLGIYLGISLTTWVGVFRIVRAETMKHKERGYVQAARVLGYGNGRILFRHILPNIAHLIIISFSVRFPAAVSTEVFMSFLGIGIRNEPSWGIMINNARVRLWQWMWWEGVAATVAVFGLVLAFNLLGDALRDALDPTLRTEK